MQGVKNYACVTGTSDKIAVPNTAAARRVSVIIPCRNQYELTLRCVESVQRAETPAELEIIIVDGGYSDAAEETFSNYARVKYTRLPFNRGFAGAINRGFHAASGRYAAVLHNDVIVPDGWLGPLIDALETDTKLGVVGPMTNWTTGTQWEQAARYKHADELSDYCSRRKPAGTVHKVAFVKSFCMVFPLDLVFRIGGFDERFFPARLEDEDFCKRASKAGFSCAIVPQSFVHHTGSVTLDTYSKSVTEIFEDNKRRFIEKWKVPPETGSAAPSEVEKPGINQKEQVPLSTHGVISELIEEGNKKVEEGDLEGAERIYRRILDQNPHSKEAAFNLSIAAIQRKNLDEAAKLTAKIHDLDNEFAPAHYADGLIAQRRGEQERSLRHFKEAIYFDVTYHQAYEAYRETAESMGRQTAGREADIVFYTAGMSFDGRTIYEKGLGGSESAMFYMARSLARLGLTVKVFNKCEKPGIYENVEYGDLTDFYIYNYFNSAKVFVSSRSFKPFMQDIHAEKMVIWLHDTIEIAYFQNTDLSSLDWDRLEPFALSRWQAGLWADFLSIPLEKFYITRNGFDPERFSIQPLERKRNKLIYSSRPIRGLEILLDVFPRIRQEVPNAELHVFTYDLNERDKEIEPFIEKIRQPGVILRGSVSQRQLAEEMLESRILAYPSIFNETSCITAIEAQAAGLPVVTAHIAALPETVIDGETGVVIKGDARLSEFQDAFVREVIDLMRNDSRWESMSRKGRERAYGLYQWDMIAKEWAEYFFGTESKARPKLSLCMIVKNEAKLLPEFFREIQDLADEIIVVDTGSTDETAAICREFGAKVYPFSWINDFAAARNESLKHAAGEMILYLDPDERIDEENRERIRKLIADPDVDAINVVEHIPQESGNLMKSTADSYCRIFRNKPEFRFEGRVHEQILPSIQRAGGKVVKSDIVIEHRHYGITEEKKKERSRRNMQILLEELKQNPHDGFILFNLGCSYRDIGNLEEAGNYFNKLLSMDNPGIKPELLATAAVYLGQIHLREGNIKEALRMANLAHRWNPENILAWYLEAAAAFDEERYYDARDALETVLNLGMNRALQKSYGAVDLHQANLDLGNCYFKMGDFHEAHHYYTKARQINAQSLDAMFNDGNSLVQLGEINEAEQIFREILDVFPDFEPAKQNLEWCLTKRAGKPALIISASKVNPTN